MSLFTADLLETMYDPSVDIRLGTSTNGGTTTTSMQPSLLSGAQCSIAIALEP